MKAFEATVLGGKARKIKERKVGEYTVLEFSVTKSRKIKDDLQYMTFYCSIFNPRDWIKNSLTEDSVVVVQGQTWERNLGEKVYRTFEVSNVLSIDSGSAYAKPVVERVDSSKPNNEDDLPF